MDYSHQVTVMRQELSNLRKQIRGLKEQHLKDVLYLKKLLTSKPTEEKKRGTDKVQKKTTDFLPVGHIQSSHEEKNGTPRQANVAANSKGYVTLVSNFGSSGANLSYGLRNLSEFSHMWLLFVFDQNQNESIKTSIKPPRANGDKKGVFSTRSPHRPNPIGMSLVKIEAVEEHGIKFTGCDLLNGTPVLDIKPFIPAYDLPSDMKLVVKEHEPSNSCPENGNESETLSKATADTVCVPKWISDDSSAKLKVIFTSRSEKQLRELSHYNSDDLKGDIEQILSADPRSNYRREKCADRLYYFTLGGLHLTVWFDEAVAEVLKVKRIDG